jgi:acyl dehydratase
MRRPDGRGQPGTESEQRVDDAHASRFGRTYEELVPGDRFRHWPGKTITEGEHHMFCLLTMAASPLHLDSEYARRNLPGGRNLVLGSYVYALVLGMSVPDISGQAVASLGVERLSHLAPVHHGDTLYSWSEIADRRVSRTRPGLGIVTVDTWGVNQD